MVWDNLARYIDDIDVLCIFHEAMRMIAKAVEGTRTPATRACFFYCIQNLVYVIRVFNFLINCISTKKWLYFNQGFFFQYKFFQTSLSDRQVISTAFSLSKLLKETNVEDIDEIGSRLMPLFAYLVEKKNHYTTNVPSYFKNTKYSTLVNRAFNGDDGEDSDNT